MKTSRPSNSLAADTDGLAQVGREFGSGGQHLDRCDASNFLEAATDGNQQIEEFDSSSCMAESYRDQILRYGRALAAGQTAKVTADIHDGDLVEQVKMFTDGNCEKRFDKVRSQVEFIEDVFENLDDLVDEYIGSETLVAYDTGSSDGDRFLRWLEHTHSPSREQSDYIACQRSRHAIESLARRHRLPHLQFQELWSVADQLVDELQTNRDLQVHLNPIRQWTSFRTNVLLDEQTTAPSNVLFYACTDQIRTAVLGLSGQVSIRVLENSDRLTLDSWLALAPDTDEEELLDLCGEAADMGVLAFG